VVVVNGVEDGPTLVVSASVHGTEVVGTGALLEVVRQTNPQQLRGRLVAITAANPFAFQVGSYFTPFISPTDGTNLGSAPFWPPDPEGRLTERIAAIIAPALHSATHAIDMHSNPDLAIPFTLVNRGLCRDDATRQEMMRMAEAFGTTVIEMPSQRPSGINGSCVANGVPAMTPELTGDLYLREDNVRIGVVGITNVMKAVGMLEGTPEPQSLPKLTGDFVYHGRLTTQRGGLMWVRRAPGTRIAAGDVAIEMMDVWGDIVEQIRMPVDGFCWSYTGGIGSSHAVPEGTQIAFVFKERGP
jgi:predicted deacylase